MSDHRLITHRGSAGAAAIVLIHGFGGDPATTWGQFPTLLMEDQRLLGWDLYSVGYSSSLTLDVSGIWAADPQIITLGGLLDTVLDVPPLDRYKSIAFFAHSMGGLLLQQALVTRPRVLARTGHVLLFGTPSLGLAKAGGLASWFKRQISDMAEGGAFITNLRDTWSKAFPEQLPFNFVAVAGDRDEFVPRKSSIDPFPDDVRRVVYGNHLQIVKPENDQHLGYKTAVKALLPGGGRDWLDSALVAVESRDFQRAITELLPHHAELDDDGLVMLALALDSQNRPDKAIEILTARQKLATDPLGVLAGRIKRRWIVEHRAADAERASTLYRQGFEAAVAAANHAQAYYHAINVAFMERAFHKREDEALRFAALALEHCERAAIDKWRYATEGEANIHLGRTEQALDGYRRALAQVPDPWQAASMYQQAVRVADLMRNAVAAASLPQLFAGTLPVVPVNEASAGGA